MPFTFHAVVVLSGTGTYTPPANVAALWIRMVAAGGGGGGAASGIGVNARGAGAGGGGYVEKFLTPLSASYSYSVGTGGNGGPDSTTNGQPGNDTTFGTLTAKGGSGGTSTSSTPDGGNPGAAGGVAGTNGDINPVGYVGGFSYKNSGRLEGSTGGGSTLGGSARQVFGNAAGNAGVAFGGGGSGAISQNNTQAGGNGANGTIIIFELKDTGTVVIPATSGLSPGIVATLIANQIYALPAGPSFIYYQGTQPQQSADQITWTNITNGTMVSGGFIRSTAGDTIVSLKRRMK